jgi:hypothetical protein
MTRRIDSACPGRSREFDKEDVMDRRISNLADQLAAGLIARREFLRKAAVITGGTAAGLTVLRRMAHAQAKNKLRVWLFKSFVTAGNDVLARSAASTSRSTGRLSATASRRPWPPSRPATRRTSPR